MKLIECQYRYSQYYLTASIQCKHIDVGLLIADCLLLLCMHVCMYGVRRIYPRARCRELFFPIWPLPRCCIGDRSGAVWWYGAGVQQDFQYGTVPLATRWWYDCDGMMIWCHDDDDVMLIWFHDDDVMILWYDNMVIWWYDCYDMMSWWWCDDMTMTWCHDDMMIWFDSHTPIVAAAHHIEQLLRRVY